MRRMYAISQTVAVALVLGATFSAAALDEVMSEADAIAVLESSSDWQARFEACQSLRHNGTAKAVPALATLLTDPELSNAARLALEPMDAEAADAALRDALEAAQGPVLGGLAISIGVRRDEKAVSALGDLLDSDNAEVAAAAAGALGRIANGKAIAELQKAKGGPREAIGEALLAAAETMTAEGDGRKAAKFYSDLLAGDWPGQIKMGAYYGGAVADPKKTVGHVLDALSDPASPYKEIAGQVVADTPAADTMEYAVALESLPDSGKVSLLYGLGERGDAEAREAVLATLSRGSDSVKRAALEALGKIGAAEDVPVLAGYLDDPNGELAATARESLRASEADGIDGALSTLSMSAGVDEKAAVIGLLADRRSDLAIPAAVANMKDGSTEVRTAALEAIASYGGPSEMPYVLTALASHPEGAEASAVSDALTTLGGVYGEDVLPDVLAAMAGASQDGQITLLRTLRRIGGEKALAAAQAQLEAPDEAVSSEALRVLSTWPGQEAAPLLLDLASMRDTTAHSAGLRGYVRLAREQGDLARRAEMLTQIRPFAKAPEEKWSLISVWGTIPSQQALDVLVPQLADPAVRNEAAAAIISAASELAKQGDGGKAAARPALASVVSQVSDADVRARAEKALAALGG